MFFLGQGDGPAFSPDVQKTLGAMLTVYGGIDPGLTKLAPMGSEDPPSYTHDWSQTVCNNHRNDRMYISDY